MSLNPEDPANTAARSEMFRFAVAVGAGAVGLYFAPAAAAAAVAPKALETAAGVVAQIVSSLALNNAADRIPALARLVGSSASGVANHDLDRVATHALLTVLYSTARESGLNEGEAKGLVVAASERWSRNLFASHEISQDQLLGLLRTPAQLDSTHARRIAATLVGPSQAEMAEPLGEAIAKTFARTFEVLLRSDEVAFRAVVVYLQRFSLDELAAVRRDLALLTNPQPKLTRFLHDGAEKKKISATDFQFMRRATTYRPDEDAWTTILQWMATDSPLTILKLTGAAGTGKSRLALELCNLFSDREHWNAGFVGVSTVWPSSWTPLKNTLVVLDYAAFKAMFVASSASLTAFGWLNSLYEAEWRISAPTPANSLRPRVRVILIDRTASGPLWDAWRASHRAVDFDALTTGVELVADRERFDALVESEFKRRTSRPFGEADRRALQRLAERLRDQFRPLFALLSAAALAGRDGSGGGDETWSPELLIESVLKGQVRQWQQAEVSDDAVDLLVLSTITRGAINSDPEFSHQVSSIPGPAYEALRSLSEPGLGLRPVQPDLLGEFLVLMRLRGEAKLGGQQREVVRARSWQLIERALELPGTGEFVGRLLQDYLLWDPAEGDNPARLLLDWALQRGESPSETEGVYYCLFFGAWRAPRSRPWHEWLDRVPPPHRTLYLCAIAMGLYNATRDEPDPRQRLFLVDCVQALHDVHGHEPVVREELAKALHTAMVDEPDPRQRLVLADRIAALHDTYGHEPAVRVELAKALARASLGEPDSRQCLVLADRVAALHDAHDHEAFVRETLALALVNAAAVEPEPRQRLVLADRIAALHDAHGREPGVRAFLAQALASAAAVAADPPRRLVLADRVAALHDAHGEEPAVREFLAQALAYAGVVEPDANERLVLAGRIAALHDAHGHEPFVREFLAQTLANATVGEANSRQCLVLADRIAALHDAHGHERGVREALAKALANTTVQEADPAQRLVLAHRLAALHDAHGREPVVREALAKALANATAGDRDSRESLALADRIAALHDAYGHEPAVREALAKALAYASVVEPDPRQRVALADRIAAFHDAHGHEPAVRELLAKALFYATVGEEDSRQCLVLADRIAALHDAHGNEPAVRGLLAFALLNAAVEATDPRQCIVLADRISALHEAHGHEPAVRMALARALVSATIGEMDPRQRLVVADRIAALHDAHGHEPAVREAFADALCSSTIVEPDPRQRLVLADRIAALHDNHGHEPAVRQALAQALVSATVGEKSSHQRLALADRISVLHDAHGYEPVVRGSLAMALANATIAEEDSRQCLALANRIAALHDAHGHEAIVRRELAKALVAVTGVEPDPRQRLVIANRLAALHDAHGNEAAVREQLDRALANTATGRSGASLGGEVKRRLAGLLRDSPRDTDVEEALKENSRQKPGSAPLVAAMIGVAVATALLARQCS